jgi:hypothetical protein
VALTQSQEAAIFAALSANRVVLPPLQMAGIGQPPATLCPSMWGGMGVQTLTPQTFGTTYSKVTMFDSAFPAFASSGLYPEGCLFDAANDDLLFAFKGVYLFSMNFVGSIPAGSDFQFTIFRNGVASPVTIGAGASNQTAAFAASTTGIAEINAGDAISVQGKADAAGRVFTPGYVSLQATRIR